MGKDDLLLIVLIVLLIFDIALTILFGHRESKHGYGSAVTGYKIGSFI